MKNYLKLVVLYGLVSTSLFSPLQALIDTEEESSKEISHLPARPKSVTPFERLEESSLTPERIKEQVNNFFLEHDKNMKIFKDLMEKASYIPNPDKDVTAKLQRAETLFSDHNELRKLIQDKMIEIEAMQNEADKQSDSPKLQNMLNDLSKLLCLSSLCEDENQ